jgi:hypothetical protein
MSGTKITNVPLARLYDTTIQPQFLRAELRPGRRWIWWGKRGWWLRRFLLNVQDGSWHKRSFVATVAEACRLLQVQEEDWTWRPAVLKESWDQPPEPQAPGVFPMF